MPKFRKKPVVVHAERWFPLLNVAGVIPTFDPQGKCNAGRIDTLEGPHIVSPGDWIITGIKGEKYPCKPDIFAATYEPADSEELSPSPDL
jgi:hypothetical protein